MPLFSNLFFSSQLFSICCNEAVNLSIFAKRLHLSMKYTTFDWEIEDRLHLGNKNKSLFILYSARFALSLLLQPEIEKYEPKNLSHRCAKFRENP